MRTLDKKQWVHPRCAIWLGSALLGRKTVLKAVKLVPPNDRVEGACGVCKKRQGALLKCDHEGCKQQFHASCAPRKGHFLNMDSLYFVNRSLASAAAANPDAGPSALALIEEGSRRGPKPSFKAYKKYNEISVNCSQLCSSHAPEEAHATLDAESIWMKVKEKIPSMLPDGCDDEVADEIYTHWVERRLENGKWGELPLLRSLEARRSAQRQEKKKRKKEQKRLTLPAGGLLHIPTDPVYNQMMQLRVEMDKARTIIDLLARRERLKKQLVQHDADELALEEWLYPEEEEEEEEEIDVGELSTDKDADGTPMMRPPPPRPPSMVVALPYGLPPTRTDLPLLRNRRRGRPRPVRQPVQFVLRWPEDMITESKRRERPNQNGGQ